MQSMKKKTRISLLCSTALLSLWVSGAEAVKWTDDRFMTFMKDMEAAKSLSLSQKTWVDQNTILQQALTEMGEDLTGYQDTFQHQTKDSLTQLVMDSTHQTFEAWKGTLETTFSYILREVRSTSGLLFVEGEGLRVAATDHGTKSEHYKTLIHFENTKRDAFQSWQTALPQKLEVMQSCYTEDQSEVTNVRKSMDSNQKALEALEKRHGELKERQGQWLSYYKEGGRYTTPSTGSLVHAVSRGYLGSDPYYWVARLEGKGDAIGETSSTFVVKSLEAFKPGDNLMLSAWTFKNHPGFSLDKLLTVSEKTAHTALEETVRAIHRITTTTFASVIPEGLAVETKQDAPQEPVVAPKVVQEEQTQEEAQALQQTTSTVESVVPANLAPIAEEDMPEEEPLAEAPKVVAEKSTAVTPVVAAKTAAPVQETQTQKKKRLKAEREALQKGTK